MCNQELYPLINKYQKGNLADFEKIYEVFDRLILYYSRLLSFDDACQELNVFLVELLYRVPLDKFDPDQSITLKKYIAASIRNQYIALSKQKQIQNSIFVEFCEDIAAYQPSFEDNLILSEALSLLTEKQTTIIKFRYIYGYSISEISAYMHISRQEANWLKNRGLLTLRRFFDAK